MMGLDTTHDAWSGPYSAFGRWREQLVAAAGYQVVDAVSSSGFPTKDYPDFPGWDDDLTEDEVMGKWQRQMPDDLIYLIWHSDCEGKIKPEQGRLIADRLETLLPNLSTEGDPRLSPRAKAERFIAGLRLAAAENKPVRFF